MARLTSELPIHLLWLTFISGSHWNEKQNGRVVQVVWEEISTLMQHSSSSLREATQMQLFFLYVKINVAQYDSDILGIILYLWFWGWLCLYPLVIAVKNNTRFMMITRETKMNEVFVQHLCTVSKWPSAADVADTSVVMHLLCVKWVCTVGQWSAISNWSFIICAAWCCWSHWVIWPWKIALGRETWFCSFKMDGLSGQTSFQGWGEERSDWERTIRRTLPLICLCSMQCCCGACFRFELFKPSAVLS